jgi:serine/threonine protein kinase
MTVSAQIQQTAGALSYLHNQGIVHGDIKGVSAIIRTLYQGPLSNSRTTFLSMITVSHVSSTSAFLAFYVKVDSLQMCKCGHCALRRQKYISWVHVKYWRELPRSNTTQLPYQSSQPRAMYGHSPCSSSKCVKITFLFPVIIAD